MSVDIVVHRSAWCGWEACESGVGGFRRGVGERLHDIMNAAIGLLKFDRHSAHYAMKVGGMGLERVGGGFDTFVGIEVNIVGKGGEFVIHRRGKFL